MPIMLPEIDVTSAVRVEVDKLMPLYKEGSEQRAALDNIVKELNKIKEANHSEWVLRNSTFVR